MKPYYFRQDSLSVRKSTLGQKDPMMEEVSTDHVNTETILPTVFCLWKSFDHKVWSATLIPNLIHNPYKHTPPPIPYKSLMPEGNELKTWHSPITIPRPKDREVLIAPLISVETSTYIHSVTWQEFRYDCDEQHRCKTYTVA